MDEGLPVAAKHLVLGESLEETEEEGYIGLAFFWGEKKRKQTRTSREGSWCLWDDDRQRRLFIRHPHRFAWQSGM